MAPQDSFIDEDDDCCPLCVEEFDLSDKNFRPCPCGYQICQFCFNNIKNNINGLCPACRRPYDDKTIEWKVVTPEEVAQFKANVQKNAKKKADQRQKEAQKREVESLNRKHLSGLRVVQKNLVYVVGLSPGIRDEDLLQTLRGDKYFGQYGKILKIVVSKAKAGETAPNNASGHGVYVTFAKNEDAARCIAAVNGSQNGERVLRAQLGTTKYCSAYLRNEVCTNKQCMFLHEPGDNENSYSRQDLSSINSVNTQRPLTSMSSSSATSSRQASQTQAPIQQAQPVAAAAQPMAREDSKDALSDGGDGSALPTTASWAKPRSRRGSQATSGAASSPGPTQSVPAAVPAAEPEEALPEPGSSLQEVDDATASPESLPPAAPRPARDPVLLDLLRSINIPDFFLPVDQTLETESYPPLFDRYGGEKRKAARERQEATENLHIDTESQTDHNSLSEHLDEEEPDSGISGSLQLGGEPEDGGSEVPQGFSRRQSTQHPIQRGSSGLFGGNPGQSFIPNLANLSTVNGRSLTPLQQSQLALMKGAPPPQSSFLDQYPPGMGSAASQTFPQTGHARHTSRFNFGTEGASASSVKPSANSKIQAQQISMMPSAHAQQAGHFYGSTMPGPPPGLKSTGTPPTFGQAFGGAMGGSSLFGGQKDNSNELLQNVMRGGRNATAGVLGHDKREYFPSFLQQYPSASSTPAPASGLLASLYGPQTGAFHDFSQKQKKKGKKHRHANTSSSGGGGLVDLADPSILQARMHQQQSNAGVGQGLYGGQTPGGYNQSMMYGGAGYNRGCEHGRAPRWMLQANWHWRLWDGQNERFSWHIVFFSFSGLMKTSTTTGLASSVSRVTAIHHRLGPGFCSYDSDLSFFVDSLVFEEDSVDFFHSKPISTIGSRSSTPSVPPGFGFPHAHPAPAILEDPIAKPKSKIAPTAAPFTPSASLNLPMTAAPQPQVSLPPTPTKPPKAPRAIANLATNAKQDVKTLATSSGLSNTIASQSSIVPPSILQPDEFPALDSGKSKPALVSTRTPAPIKSSPSIATTKKPVVQSSSKAKVVPTLSGNVEEVAKSPIATSSFPPLPVSTPSVATTPVSNPPQRPVTTTTKTTKLTLKTDTPPATTAPSSATSLIAPTYPSSRHPSIVSTAKLERSGTPTSENISDNASITSASMSRASSPPPQPSKVGSAPVRATTKSMQKKQRRDAQREREKFELEIATTPIPEEEPEIAPIMGRKKKQKKEKPKRFNTNSATGGSTPAGSRAPSPGPPESAIETSHTAIDIAEPEPIPDKPVPNATSKGPDMKGKGKGRNTRPPSPEPAPIVEEPQVEEPVEKALPTPASIVQELMSSGVIPDITNTFLKATNLSSRHQEPLADLQSSIAKLLVTMEDREILLSGSPVHKNVDGHRIMLTPNGDCVRNLTPEEEQRFLQLQLRIAHDDGPAAFQPARHDTTHNYIMVGGRAILNGPPSFLPIVNPNGNLPVDPVVKIHHDEGLNSINQYLLPSLSTGGQIDRAFLTSGLESDNLRTWASDPAGPDGSFGPSNTGSLTDTITTNFPIGRPIDRSQPLGGVHLLTLPEAESAMALARKETEGLEKRLNGLLKKNKRLLLGSGH